MTKEVFTELMPLLKCEKVLKYSYYVGFWIFPCYDYEYVSEVMISFMKMIEESHGTIEGYFSAIGIGSEEQ